MRKNARGRPLVGSKVETRLPENVIQRVDNLATAHGASRADTLRTLIVTSLQQQEQLMPVLASFPALPDQVTVASTSSDGFKDPAQVGYDPSEWHCLVVRRPRLGDARVGVYPPNSPHEPVFEMFPTVEDLYEGEDWGHLAVRAVRPYLRVLAGDATAWTELREIMAESDYLRGQIMANYRARIEAAVVAEQEARDAEMYGY
ncbi:hypothetical protein GCM10009731_04790 [Streptomyces globosus]